MSGSSPADGHITPALGLAVITWLSLDVDTWEEFGRRMGAALRDLHGGSNSREVRSFIRSFWPPVSP